MSGHERTGGAQPDDLAPDDLAPADLGPGTQPQAEVAPADLGPGTQPQAEVAPADLGPGTQPQAEVAPAGPEATEATAATVAPADPEATGAAEATEGRPELLASGDIPPADVAPGSVAPEIRGRGRSGSRHDGRPERRTHAEASVEVSVEPDPVDRSRPAGEAGAADPAVTAAPVTAPRPTGAPRWSAPPPGDPAERVPDLRLATLHLRGGLLGLARAELEAAAGIDGLDQAAILDLAEVRWRTGDLRGAASAASAWLDVRGMGARAPRDEALAHVVLAEASAARGRDDDVAHHAASALGALGSLVADAPASRRRRATAGEPVMSLELLLDSIFAGIEPHAAVWPSQGRVPPARPAGPDGAGARSAASGARPVDVVPPVVAPPADHPGPDADEVGPSPDGVDRDQATLWGGLPPAPSTEAEAARDAGASSAVAAAEAAAEAPPVAPPVASAAAEAVPEAAAPPVGSAAAGAPPVGDAAGVAPAVQTAERAPAAQVTTEPSAEVAGMLDTARATIVSEPDRAAILLLLALRGGAAPGVVLAIVGDAAGQPAVELVRAEALAAAGRAVDASAAIAAAGHLAAGGAGPSATTDGPAAQGPREPDAADS